MENSVSKILSAWVFFTILLVVTTIAEASYDCREYFKIQTINSYYTINQKYLDEILTPDFLNFKENPTDLAKYIRNQVGYSTTAFKKKPIPYFAAILPYFKAIVDAIPNRNLSSIIVLMTSLHSKNPNKGINVKDTHSLHLLFEKYKSGVSVVDFNNLAFYVLFVEHIYIWGIRMREMDHLDISSLYRVYAFALSDLNRAYSIGLLPLITFEFTDHLQFKSLWKEGASPISIRDTLADPYDGLNELGIRSRFRFALHDVFHLALFEDGILSPLDRLLNRFPIYSVLRYVLNPSKSKHPAYIKRLNYFISKSEKYISSLNDKAEADFITNVMWWLLHEENNFYFIIKAMGDRKYSNSELYKYRRMIIIFGLSKGDELLESDRFAWMLPDSLREVSMSHGLNTKPLESMIEKYLNYIEGNEL